MAANGGVVMVTFIPSFVNRDVKAWSEGLDKAAKGAASGSTEVAAGAFAAGSFIDARVASAPDGVTVIAARTAGGAETASDNTGSWRVGPVSPSGGLSKPEGPDRPHAANPATKPSATTVTTTPAARRLGT